MQTFEPRAPRDTKIRLHGPADFAGMRKAGRLAAEALDLLVEVVQPGVTTEALDRLMFSFAMGADTRVLQKGAGGFLWLAILFASVLSLGESFRVEAENSALDGLRLIPTDARAVFLGKALGNAVLLFTLSVALLPVMFALFEITLVLSFGRLLATGPPALKFIVPALTFIVPVDPLT